VIDETKHQGLIPVPGYPFEVLSSASTREQATLLADRCGQAFAYLGDLLAFRPRCALLVLDRAGWAERASSPSYALPYYDAGNLFLTGEPSDLTAWLEDLTAAAPPAAARALDQVYGTGPGRLKPFGDTLVVHELAHAFHDGVPFGFPRSWLMELFADMALYAFMAFQEADRLPYLETLPRVALDHGLLQPETRDLRSFEARYPHLEPLTYVWYQFRFTMMAKAVVDEAGPQALHRLWDTFALTDERLASVLREQVHPAAGEWLTGWSS
jgi:hypothetical protein